MSSRKFNKAEAHYKKTRQWKFIEYMGQQASSYDDYKKVAQYIIDSGVYLPGMPKDVGFYERQENWLQKGKFSLLASILIKYRDCCQSEKQILEYINLSLENDLWRAYHTYHISNAPYNHTFQTLNEVASTFESYHFLYLYDYIDTDKSAFYLKKLELLTSNEDQKKQIKEATKIVKAKFERFDNMD